MTDIPEGWTFLRQLPKKGTEDRGLGAHHDMLRPPLGSATLTCQHLQPTCHLWPVLAGKSPAPPTLISCMGTMVMDPSGFWLQPFGSISNASSSMVAPPRRLALHLRCGPNSSPSCCQVKFTSVDPLEPPKENESCPTPWPMRETWVVTALPLPPTKK